MATRTRASKATQRKAECVEALRRLVQPGDTVYTSLVHVSRSGMYRVIKLYAMVDNQPIRLDGYASDLLEGYDDRHEGCKASGVGMDMGFHLVYNLAFALWPDGWECIGEDCPHSSHIGSGSRDNPRGEGVIHMGGYALRHRWL